uniref:glucan endo-1,3-beta-D-glucosidase n=1 Tax=Populus alba TaxID=43335 RepID=A0A4U5N8C3_POPAL|nr:hypothetical protein D5086_0000275460 [Populus alba]
MAKLLASSSSSTVSTILLLASAFNILGVLEGSIGVNYGTVADNLPPPAQVAHFLLESTIINRVRLFDTNTEIIQAFAHTGIAITITVPNDLIPHLAKLGFAQEWVKSNVQPYVPATNIVRILVGNEVISPENKLSVASLAFSQVQARHPLENFDKDTTRILKPLLRFLRATNSPFMINSYPFFGFSADTLDYALFRPNSGVFDENTKLSYTNMLDGQLDAVFSAMKLLGFSDIEIVIAETGWPSQGESSQLGVDAESAAQYNRNLMQHVTSGAGTPLMPNRTFETYIFALFNEDLKPGPPSERNFGLFQPDMTPVYDIGILRPKAKSSIPTSPAPVSPRPGGPKEKIWCLPKTGADVEALQRNIDYVCGLEAEYCKPIQEGGECFLPNTVKAHAAFAMNAYYQGTEKNGYDCDFEQTAAISNVDPSYGNCKY